MSDLPKPSEVSAVNIIKPGLDELLDEHHQAYEALKKQREEAFEALKKKHEEEDLQAFLASFKKDCQGNITPVGKVNFPPLIDEQDEITVSKVFSPEQVAVIESLVSKGNVMTYNSFVANTNAKKICLHHLVVLLVYLKTLVQLYLFHRHLLCNNNIICR